MPNTFPVVMTNLAPQVATHQTHAIPIPPACCPISQEPQEGSAIAISYNARNGHLEVMQLANYINSFKGGIKCPHSGEWVVRDMEHMIQVVAQQCADWLGDRVRVRANLRLKYGDVLVKCSALPQEDKKCDRPICPQK